MVRYVPWRNSLPFQRRATQPGQSSSTSAASKSAAPMARMSFARACTRNTPLWIGPIGWALSSARASSAYAAATGSSASTSDCAPAAPSAQS